MKLTLTIAYVISPQRALIILKLVAQLTVTNIEETAAGYNSWCKSDLKRRFKSGPYSQGGL